jgi:hypothetical protein
VDDYRRVTVLTTERCVAAVFQSINENAITKQAENDDGSDWPVVFGGHLTTEVDRFDVIQFFLPPYCRDLYAIELQRACKKQTMPQCVSAYADHYPSYEIISNLVKQVLPDLWPMVSTFCANSSCRC